MIMAGLMRFLCQDRICYVLRSVVDAERKSRMISQENVQNERV